MAATSLPMSLFLRERVNVYTNKRMCVRLGKQLLLM
jgi:hypothetical protein